MIRQIVLTDESTGREAVGILLTTGDLEDVEILRLGERLVRTGEATRGHLGDVRYHFEMLEAEVPGLEFQTVRIPQRRPTLEPAPHPCDRLPWWVWAVAVAIVIGAFIAGVRADG